VIIDHHLYCSCLNRIKAHGRRAYMNGLGRTLLCRMLCALLLILKSHAFIQLSCDSELRGQLATLIICILLKEIRAGISELAAAYAALSIYCDVDHKIIPSGY
jgi:hypothetical protein